MTGFNTGGLTVDMAVALPPSIAVIVINVVEETAVVVTVNVAVVPPCGTVTVAGPAAMSGLLLESVTTDPPDGAALEMVTVPVEEFPPTTMAGLSVMLEIVGAPETNSNAPRAHTPVAPRVLPSMSVL